MEPGKHLHLRSRQREVTREERRVLEGYLAA